MSFPENERLALLKVHGVGPRVIERLEAVGIGSLDQLAQCDAEVLCAQIGELLRSTCWRNSPQARGSIQAAIDYAVSANAPA